MLYFAANDGTNGNELWRTDGTVAGTQMVRDLFTGTYSVNYQNFPNSSNPTQLTNVGGKLFFTARNGVAGVELWTSDGTSAGTTLVKNIYADVKVSRLRLPVRRNSRTTTAPSTSSPTTA